MCQFASLYRPSRHFFLHTILETRLELRSCLSYPIAHKPLAFVAPHPRPVLLRSNSPFMWTPVNFKPGTVPNLHLYICRVCIWNNTKIFPSNFTNVWLSCFRAIPHRENILPQCHSPKSQSSWCPTLLHSSD